MEYKSLLKGKIINREKGLVEGTVHSSRIILRVRGGLPPGTAYVTVALNANPDGSVKVGCHGRDNIIRPVTCIADPCAQERGHSI